nr:MAG TPA: hypothetical protein [Caudoviricetes sp.]
MYSLTFAPSKSSTTYMFQLVMFTRCLLYCFFPVSTRITSLFLSSVSTSVVDCLYISYK